MSKRSSKLMGSDHSKHICITYQAWSNLAWKEKPPQRWERVSFKRTQGEPLRDHLESGIWEVRSRLGTRIARVLFALDGDTMVGSDFDDFLAEDGYSFPHRKYICIWHSQAPETWK